jgi:hypothetical protein
VSPRRTTVIARLTRARRGAWLATLAATAACGGPPDARDAPAGESPNASAPAVFDLDSVARVQRAESLAIASGRWNAVEVVSRLEAAGLVVRDLDRPVRAAGFSAEGRTLAVSGGELVVFLYDDARARLADTRSLDSAAAAPPGADPAWPSTPRLITSGNLAAVLFTDREQLAERVRNVLTARHGG